MKVMLQKTKASRGKLCRGSPAAIERAIRQERWSIARHHIQIAMRSRPKDHWLLTRLSTTYYEQRAYRRALGYCLQAYTLAPHCPLVLWDLACALQMSGDTRKAKEVFRRLIRHGVNRISAGDCSEGRSWARGLIADCWYRLARCERDAGRSTKAMVCIRRHLRLRGRGCHSIYSGAAVRAETRLWEVSETKYKRAC